MTPAASRNFGRADRFRSDAIGPGAGLLIDRQRRWRLQRSRLVKQPHGVQQRIVRLVGLKFFPTHVAAGRIGARVAVKAHHSKVEKSGLAAGAHVMRRLARDLEGVINIKTVSTEIFKSRPLRKARGNPALRGPDRNANAVILADE